MLNWFIHNLCKVNPEKYVLVSTNEKRHFEELLEKNNSCKIHDRNLQKLITKIFKVKMNLAPEVTKEVFEIAECLYALKNELKIKSKKIHSVTYGIETVSFVGARVWNSLPSDFKKWKSLELFKSEIKNRILENCPCKLWRPYLQRVGYVQIAD